MKLATDTVSLILEARDNQNTLLNIMQVGAIAPFSQGPLHSPKKFDSQLHNFRRKSLPKMLNKRKIIMRQ